MPPTSSWVKDGRYSSTWKYVLKFDRPSRIATMKNALGDSVRIIPSYTPPSFDLVSRAGLITGPWTDSRNSVTISSILDSNKWLEPPPYSGTFVRDEANPECSPGPGVVAGCTTFVFQLNYGAGAGSEDPGPPFDAIANWATGYPSSMGTWSETPPANVVGSNKEQINWGLIAYSNTAADTCGSYNTTASNLLVTAINPSGTDVTGILYAMRLTRDGGIPVGGGTPTRSALEKAEQHLLDTFAVDPLYNCLRNYGVILVTDGESNTCNQGSPANKEWGGPCPAEWQKYPPGITDDIWNLNLTTPCVGKAPRATPINPRTWVIGFGADIGKCELNYTAYKGRTDANDPKGTAGYNWLSDPRLCATPNGTGGCTTSTYDDSQDYAFFAQDTSGLVKAFKEIVAAPATGDYATGAPMSGGAAGSANFIFLPSSNYPLWEGHLYKLNTNSLRLNPDGTTTELPGYRVWDAGAVLAAKSADARKIYTWNPSTLNLVEVNADSLGTLKAIEPSLTAATVDFIRGNDGSGSPRAQKLGPIINVVPSLVTSPPHYTQGTLAGDHDSYEGTYKARKPLLWVGSNDGMLHAFDYETGDEIVALMPPQLLGRQNTLYANFIAKGKKGTGQPDEFANIYGVAGSLRFLDVFFSTGSPTGWRTVGVLTLAEGGDLIAAIDITHPSSTDPDYGSFRRTGDLANAPVQVLWQKTGTDLPGYYQGWSLPAIAPRSASQWTMLFGSGYNTASVYSSQQKPRVFELDPTDGSVVGSTPAFKELELDATAAHNPPWVGSQAFADGVLFRIASSRYEDDNVATRGLQADLNGRIWFADPNGLGSGVKIGIDASAVAGQSQPIYYPPAAGGYGDPASVGCNVYSFGSGTFYEVSKRVNGPYTGSPGYFIPSLYLAAASKANWDLQIPSDKVLRIKINEILRPGSTTQTLSPLSQMTAAPYLLIDPSGIKPSQAVFVVYDPTVGCNGASYAVSVAWQAPSCDPVLSVSEGTTSTTSDPSGAKVTTKELAKGVASGLTTVGDKVFTGIPGIGVGEQATLQIVPATSVFGTGSTFRPIWWKELK